MIRETAKTVIAKGTHYAGLDRLLSRWRGKQEPMPLVVSYHRVVENFERSARWSIAPMLTTRNTFEQHLDWIGEHYDFVSLDAVSEFLSNPRPRRKPLAALTFDDGYRDVYDNAFPVLLRKGIPATVFVVSGLIGTHRLQLHDELYLACSHLHAKGWPLSDSARNWVVEAEIDEMVGSRLLACTEPFQMTRVLLESMCQSDLRRLADRLSHEIAYPTLEELRSLDWGMLAEMQRGGITIGSHTRTHALLTNESAWCVEEELQRSRREIELRLREPVKYFAYPDGRFNRDVVEQVRQAGYSLAFTTCAHRDDYHPELTLPRTLLWERSCKDNRENFSSEIMSCLVHGVFDASKCSLEHG